MGIWIITRLVQDFLRKCTVRLEQEVQNYGTANREQNNKSLPFFVDNQVIIAQDKDDTEYETKILT